MIRDPLAFVSYKNRKALVVDLKPIYQANTVKEAERMDQHGVRNQSSGCGLIAGKLEMSFDTEFSDLEASGNPLVSFRP